MNSMERLTPRASSVMSRIKDPGHYRGTREKDHRGTGGQFTTQVSVRATWFSRRVASGIPRVGDRIPAEQLAHGFAIGREPIEQDAHVPADAEVFDAHVEVFLGVFGPADFGARG